MTTDIRTHRDHNLEFIATRMHKGPSKAGQMYCQTCDLFLTNLGTVTITIDKVTIKTKSQKEEVNS